MDIKLDFAWSTHVPLVKACLTEFNPELIVELGVGRFSTPMFVAQKPQKLILVENDKQWAKYIEKEYSVKVIHHALGRNIPLGAHPKDLTASEKAYIRDYYLKLKANISTFDLKNKLLFVDNFTCCRTIAINTLYESFDIVLYHDCEPAGVTWYEYKFNKGLLLNFDNYIFKTPKSWAGVFISKQLKNYDIFERIQPFILQYCAENHLNSEKFYLSGKSNA